MAASFDYGNLISSQRSGPSLINPNWNDSASRQFGSGDAYKVASTTAAGTPQRYETARQAAMGLYASALDSQAALGAQGMKGMADMGVNQNQVAAQGISAIGDVATATAQAKGQVAAANASKPSKTGAILGGLTSIAGAGLGAWSGMQQAQGLSNLATAALGMRGK
jgi:hypothetical protein